MANNFKRRLAVFLAAALVLPGLLAAFPMTAVEVQAAQSDYAYSETGEKVSVEAGQEFNIGDYVSIYKAKKGVTVSASMEADTGYSSTNTTVATVDSAGNLAALSEGTTTIKVTYGSSAVSMELTVVPKGSFKTSDSYNKIASLADEIAKNIPSQVTVKNGYDLLKRVCAYEKACKEANAYTIGIVYEDGICKILIPAAGRYKVAYNMLEAYARENSPTSTASAKKIKIAAVSANAKKGITVKLKKAITEKQILGLQIQGRDTTAKPTMTVTIQDKSNGSYYEGYAMVKKGTTQVTFKLRKSVWKNGKNKYSKKKFIKGHTYVIGSKWKGTAGYWARGKKVTIK